MSDRIRDEIRAMLRSLEGIGPRLDEIRQRAQPFLDYVDLTFLGFPTDTLQASLTEMAENLLRIRDELAANQFAIGTRPRREDS